MSLCEPNHTRWRQKANHYFSLYNNYNDFRSALASASPRGVDEVWREGQETYGTDLFVPVAFGIVEATVPLVINQRPRMLVIPRKKSSEDNVQYVQQMIDSQQQQMGYDLVLEEIAKTALMLGLGIQKVRWHEKYKTRKRLARSENPESETGWQVMTDEDVLVYDDPICEAVDPFDFFWDPAGKDIETCEYVVQRSWRPMSYVAQMARLGKWRNLDDLAFVDGLGGSTKYDEAWQGRLEALGYGNMQKRGADRLHEVLEFHDGNEIVTVLDREICVAAGENPNWHGEKPYQINRPTLVPGRFEGKGVIEPVEGLSAEINDLRRSRRDNARLILQQCFAFHEGMIEVDDFKFGPGLGIPTNGDPREILMPIKVGDIPYAGYQEEQALQADIRFASGMADPNDQPGVQQTATGAQLVHSAVSRRAAGMTRRLELEIAAGACHQMCELNQQRIMGNRDVRIPAQPTPGQPDRRWTWVEVTPEMLWGEFEFAPEGGTGADNSAQDRNDAQDLWTMFSQNPLVKQDWLVREVLKKLGYKVPQDALAPPDPRPPVEVLNILSDKLVKAGNKPEQATAFIAEALNEALAQEDGGKPPGPAPAPAPPAPA